MKLTIARWENSLALSIPTEYARRAGLKEGDSVEASLPADGGIAIRRLKWNRKASAQELAMMRDAMPTRTSVTDELRRTALYTTSTC